MRKNPIIQEFLIYGANTDVGKTVVSAALCRFAATLGRPVTYVKPVQTGEDTDAAALKRHVPEGQLKTETRPNKHAFWLGPNPTHWLWMIMDAA